MLKLPYIEPTIRTIAGALVTSFAIAIIWLPENIWLWFFLMMFVSLNLFQSGFTRFCLMEKLLQRLGLRSEMAEIQRLGEQNKLHRETLDLLNETVIELSNDARLVYRSNNWGSLIEGSALVNETELPPSLSDFLHPEDRAALAQLLAKLDTEQIETLRFRIGTLHDTERWIEGKFIRLRTAKGGTIIRGVLRDISEYYLQEKRISHMAMHDALTGLPNRILLDDRLDNALIQAHRTGKKLAVMFIDLDNFKQINDIHGHKIGDQLLIAVSNVLKNSLRQSDTLARWGGDEFVILLPNLDTPDEAKLITQGIVQAVKKSSAYRRLGKYCHPEYRHQHISRQCGGCPYPAHSG